MEKNRYLNYQEMVTTVTTGIAQLDGVCRHISMEAQADDLKNAGNKLKNHIFSVGIMGEFRRGKSTVINALLGQDIVPADIVPCSATLNYVRWDTNKRAEIRFKNGEVKEVPVEELSNYVTKITKASEEMSATVEDATVFYPCPFCQNGVQIVDTPGLNDDERMTSISEHVIPSLDAIIMVLVPDSPFSQSEAEFVRNKLMVSDLGKLIFVVNKIDIIDEDDRPRLLTSIKEKIESSVLEKMAAIYGKDSDAYKNAKEKLGDIKLLPVSAKQALKGKLKNNPGLLENSGYMEFEKVLSTMLTEERGIIQLLPPVNKIISVSKTALETIHTRKEALTIDAQEFEKIQTEAIETITSTRAKKKEEVTSLKAQGKSLYVKLLPQVGEIYTTVEKNLMEYTEECSIGKTDLEDTAAIQAFTDRISKEFDQRIQDVFSLHTEKLIYQVREHLDDAAEDLKVFNAELEDSLGEIRSAISLSSSGTGILDGFGTNMAIEAGTLYGMALLGGVSIPGIGGLISGFKAHGVKGAVTGGASGMILGLAATIAGASMGIFGLPLAVIAGAASTCGGSAITSLIFGKKDGFQQKAEEIRQNLRSAATDIANKLRESQSLEKWLNSTCEEAYNMLAADIDKEWEMSLQGMEDTLTQIKIDLEMNAANKEKCEESMNEYEDAVKGLLGKIGTIQQKLSSALNS